jgi:hypothetical protein
VGGGADGARYEPKDWQVLDRQVLSAALGAAWRSATRSARLSLSASYHAFPHSRTDSERRREDARVGLELDGSVEGRGVVRYSAGGYWNQSRIPAYDFRMGRASLILSVPLGKGSMQGYAALAHQVYMNPGPREARVAPSDQDSGSVLSVQYTYPLNPIHQLSVRGGWSRSQTGFRDDFYERIEVGLDLSFRGS